MIKQRATLASIHNTDIFYNHPTIDFKSAYSQISKIPKFLFKRTHKIYVHRSEHLMSLGLEASHYDGLVEIDASAVEDLKHLSKLILHELFHSVEPEVKAEGVPWTPAYDATVQEYLKKKRKLLIDLRDSPEIENPKSRYFKQTDYSSEFDQYLFNTVGYSVLHYRCTNLFPSPYSATSISEYIAVSLEVFFFENNGWLQRNCPAVSNLINTIFTEEP